MKKTAFLAIAAILTAACAKEIPGGDTQVNPQPTDELSPGVVLLQAGFETPEAQESQDAKVSVSDAGALTWSAEDKIAVWTSNGESGKFCEFTLYTGAGTNEASFTGTPDEGYSVSTLAVYPASAAASYEDGSLTVSYPDAYEYGEGARNVRMAAYFADAADGLTFKHLGGLIRFSITNIPAEVNCFKLSSDKPVSGNFAVNASKEAVSAASAEDEIEISFDAGSLSAGGTFSVPVPVGSYNFTAGLYTRNGSSYTACNKSIKSTTKSIARKDYIQMKSYAVISGGIYYVKTNGSETNDGSSWAEATTLEKALWLAEDGETIKVAAGTYTATESLKADDGNWNVYWVKTACTLEGGYAGSSESETPDYAANETVIDADGAYHALVINTPAAATDSVTVKGFTLTGGVSAADATSTVAGNGSTLLPNTGAGLLVRGGNARVMNCKILGNNPSAAGNYKTAVFINNAAGRGTRLADCTLTGNANLSCGVIVAAETATLTGTTITGFNCGDMAGSAVRNTGGTVTLSNCDINGNVKANVNHAGILYNNSTLNVNGGYIRNNTATSVIHNYAGKTTLNNVEISGNTGGSSFGMMRCYGGSGIEMNGGSIKDNTGGEAVIIKTEGAKAVFDGVTISGNSGTFAGFENGNELELKNCSVSSNVFETATNNSTTRGGLILNKGTLTIDKCDITGTTFNNMSCILYSGDGTYNYITNSSFVGNLQSNHANAESPVRLLGTAKGLIANCTFLQNGESYASTSQGQGTILVSGNAVLYIVSTTMTRNTPYNYGGIRGDSNNAQLYLYNTVVAGNAASGTTKDMDVTGNYVKAKVKCALGTGTGSYAVAHFFDANSADIFTSSAHYQYTGNCFNTVKTVANGTQVVPVKAAERSASNYATNLANAGMTASELTALSIDLGQGVFDSSVFGYDQAGNERTGTMIGAYVGD